MHLNLFFKTIIGVLLALLVSSPAFADYASMDDGWSGLYKASQKGGVYEAKVNIDGRNVVKFFEECKRFSSGHAGSGIYCRGTVNGGGESHRPTSTSGHVDLSGSTKFAVFKTVKLYTGSQNFARLNNGTSSDVPFALQKCAQAGGNCVIVDAESPSEALLIVKAMYPSWPLGQTVY